MEPFRQAAQRPQNERQPDPLVEAGGLRTGRAKTHPGRLHIDAYVAFYANEHGVRIQCCVKEQGDQPPLFLLRVDNNIVGVYNLAGLPAALATFQQLIEAALIPTNTTSDLRALAWR